MVGALMNEVYHNYPEYVDTITSYHTFSKM